MKRRELQHYLKRAEELLVEPNFFMSLPYLRLSNVKCVESEGWIWIADKRWCLFEPLPIGKEHSPVPPVDRIWALFQSKSTPLNGHYSFLDWQYIFDPTNFLHMDGKYWQVFRKNCRKWPKRNIRYNYTSQEPSGTEAGLMIADWIERKGGSIMDGELLARFAYFEEDADIFKKYLYNNTGQLVGINAWDKNWRYINYRVCMSSPDEPFLNEFIRWLFYTDPEICKSGMLVNDGGALDSAGLEFFKDKMNPIDKLPLYSWIK